MTVQSIDSIVKERNRRLLQTSNNKIVSMFLFISDTKCVMLTFSQRLLHSRVFHFVQGGKQTECALPEVFGDGTLDL